MVDDRFGAQARLLARYLDHIGDGTGYKNGNIKVASLGDATFDVTGGVAEDQWTLTSHGLITGDVVQFSVVGTGAEPFVVDTDYYVIKLTANTFQLATTQALAVAGTEIAGTGSDSSPTWTIDRMATDMLIAPAAGTIYRIAKLALIISDTTGFTSVKYGTLSALSNGVTVKELEGATLKTDFTDSVPILDNVGIVQAFGPMTVTSWGSGNDIGVATLDFRGFGQMIRLVGDDSGKLAVNLNDDLTGLLVHRFMAYGYTEKLAE